ncbi:MAG: hypothetical protein C4519_06280 [Desulfobacteraceae bacterium]|nr:MAG: hypothetical protein C4519_06280 [Desulfobacteraceae bacterium]
MPSLNEIRKRLKDRSPNNLILLIGRNPVPNFVAACILQPQTVYAIFTDDTEDVKDRLKKALASSSVSWDRGAPKFEDVPLIKATDVDEVCRAVKSIPGGSALHYTGGMKTMAAHVYHFWREAGGGVLGQASYLDESSTNLCFDDGVEENVDGAVLISVKGLAELHGLREFRAQSVPGENSLDGNPSANDAALIVAEALKDPEGISKLNNLEVYFKVNFTHEEGDPIHAIFSKLSCSVPFSPAKAKNGGNHSEWINFIKYHKWLEVFTAHCVAEAGRQIESEGFEPGETLWNVTGETLAGRDFEIDVAHCRGHKIHVLSCTAAKPSNGLGKAKNKLFEVSLRARQLGGDFARSAVVCFLGPVKDKKTGSGQNQVRELQGDVEAAYGPIDEKGNRLVAHVPKVFGINHIKAWLDGDLSSLKKWLKG